MNVGQGEHEEGRRNGAGNSADTEPADEFTATGQPLKRASAAAEPRTVNLRTHSCGAEFFAT
jgi:hypothetical protein